MILRFFSSALTGDNSAPSAATDGVSLAKLNADDATILINGAVTSGQVGSAGTPKLWLYYEGTDQSGNAVGVWSPAGTDPDSAADKGELNEGFALAETGTDVVRHAERVYGLRDASRAHLQFTGISNMDSVQAYLVRRGGAR